MDIGQVSGRGPRDVTRLTVSSVGSIRDAAGPTGVVMMDESGAVDLVVADYLRSLAAFGATTATLRSYALALLRWWRFLDAVGIQWDQASAVDVRDFVLWMRSATGFGSPRDSRPSLGYAPATINHNLAVLASFYASDAAGQRQAESPVPGAERRRHPHHNPMRAFLHDRRTQLRQKMPRSSPRGLSDTAFNDLFAAMRNDRDRALLAFYVSTGARASELLGVTEDRVDVGRQVIGVHRKGSGRLQWLPASSDSFVWLRLYQQHQTHPLGGTALWLTLRSPYRPLTYAAMRRVLQRADQQLGTRWTLHDLRHTAARRMVADPRMSLTDVQWVLGHAHLTTTEIYLAPREDEVVARVLAHHAERADRERLPSPPLPAYKSDVLAVLFGEAHRER